MTLRTDVCWVGSTPALRLETDIYFELDIDQIADRADPANWPRAYPRLWKRMIPNGTDAVGYTRMIEHAHWMGMTQRVPLRFWKTRGRDSFCIRYGIDKSPVDPRRVGTRITVDQGHFMGQRQGSGTRIKTLKLLACPPALPWVGRHLVGFFGYEEAHVQMVHTMAGLTDYHPFEISGAQHDRI